MHPLADYLDLLKLNGKLVLVGVPPEPLALPSGSLIFKRRTIGGSLIGGIRETQEMLVRCTYLLNGRNHHFQSCNYSSHVVICEFGATRTCEFFYIYNAIRIRCADDSAIGCLLPYNKYCRTSDVCVHMCRISAASITLCQILRRLMRATSTQHIPDWQTMTFTTASSSMCKAPWCSRGV